MERRVEERTTELKKANQELQRLSEIDGLTQIANRRYFDQYLTQEWHRLQREQRSLSLSLCDFDFFKNYNDFYGHPGGDDCLQRVAQLLRQTVKRPADLVARYGGEEFAAQTSNLALLGQESVNGAKIAEDYFNQNGGVNSIPVKLIFQDAGGDEASAINAFQTLITQAKALGIVGPRHPLNKPSALHQSPIVPKFQSLALRTLPRECQRLVPLLLVSLLR